MDYLIFLVPFAIMALIALPITKPGRCPQCRRFGFRQTGRERRLGIQKWSFEYRCRHCGYYTWWDMWRRW